MTTEEIAFIESEQKKAREAAAMSMEGRANLLCSRANCDDVDRRKHVWLYCHENWSVHPSDRFKRWWENQGWKETEDATERGWSFLGKDGLHHPLKTITAYNCDAVREVYGRFCKRQDDELRRFKTPWTQQQQPERKTVADENRTREPESGDEPIPF